jgi:Uma2 family endonuclease
MALREPAVDEPVVVPMSWAEYQALPESFRHEYIGGCLIVNPHPVARHQRALHALVRLLDDACPPGFWAVGKCAWKPGPDEFGPDVMVCERDNDAVRFTDAPQVIIEVLSSRPAYDLVRKSAKYAAAGLPRYWVVDPAAPSITAFELRDGDWVDVGTASADERVELDFGVGRVTICPAELMD